MPMAIAWTATAAAAAGRQPCLRRKSLKLRKEEELEDHYCFVFL